MRRIALSVLLLVLLLGAPAATAGDCDRACTLQAAETALAALQSGQAGKALPRGIRITENGRDIRAADSQLFAIRRITARQTYLEPATGAAGVVGASEAYGGPAIFAVRMKLKGDRVSEVETLVVRRTESPVFSPWTFRDFAETSLPPRPTTPGSRQDLVAIASAWLDELSGVPAVPEVIASDCKLFSNGAPTTSSGACLNASGLQGPGRDRRLALVDEGQGVVWVWAAVDLPEVNDNAGRPGKSAPRSVLFAARLVISQGQIHDIDLVQRDLSPGAITGWALPKSRKRP